MTHTTDPIDPFSFIDITKNTNLYGQEHAFGKLEKLDCDEIKRIANEPFFSQETIDKIFGEHIDFTKAGDKRFVATDEEKIRIAIILISAKANIFLLIEGPTSSAKTYSVLIAFNIFITTNFYKTMQKALYPNSKGKTPKNIILRINLSEDSSREDFVGSIVYDDSINRFIFKQGAFSKAFEYGYWLLIDELSLAPPSVLQAIEAALDIKLLIVQGLGGTREIKMHPNFFVICTTNPNNEDYSRFILSSQFLDRFHKIYFDNLSNKELERIMIEKCQRKNIDDQIQKVNEAHKMYTGPSGPRCKNMYTLRELDRACILFERNFHYDYERIIDILYRTRAGENLLTYDANNDIFNDIPDVIKTDDRIKYGQLALDCLDNGFNIILENDFNSGNSEFAKIIAKKFNIIKKNPLLPLIVSLTKDIRVSDLTELSIPFSKVHGEQKEMKIKILKGVIYKAAEEGRVLILEDLERGNTRVLESINDIYESNPVYSEINKLQRNINVHENFRIIYTMHSNVPNKISAAFFNRFIHIKMKDNGEIANHFHIPKGIPLNIKAQNFPDSIHIENSNDLCNNAKVAHTTQIDAIFKYTKASIDSKIPVCILGESGYGRNIAINLILKDKFEDKSKINTIYCTSETTREMLIGKYAFEGRLLFNEGPLIKAATKGGVLIIKNIDKLTHHAFSCIETVLNFIEKEDREPIIPGFDLSEFKFSKEFYCIATIDGVDESKIPNYILKNFVIKKIPEPTENDYIEIYKSIFQDYANHKTEFDTLVKCFLSCNDIKKSFDTSFRMFTRVLISFERNYQAELLKEQAINIYALFQNAKTKNKESLIAKLLTKIDFNVSEIDKQISSDVYIKGNQLVKGPLACSKIQFQQLEMLKSLSKEQLNVVFYLKMCKTPIVLIGSTSFRETIIRQNVPNKVKSFNVADFTTTDDMIGSISFKRNIQPTGQFKHGDIYDTLIEYMSNDISTNENITKLDLNSPESFEKVKEIIQQMDDGKLKPYYQYLMNIVEHENDYATFFEMGYLSREILLGNTVLLKNIDQLNASVIDSLIPFLNETIDLNEYIPGVTYSPQHCQLFFTCSEQEYEKLSSSFRSRVQAVYIGALGKDDIKKYVDDNILLEAYDAVIHDYSDITRAINVIKIAGVLNNFDSPEDRISIANTIISLNPENYNENKVFGTLKEEKNYSLDELVNYDQNTSELKSLRTGATIKVQNFNKSELTNFVYVPSVACLLDLCIISIATHIPLIVESSPGQSKSTLAMQFGKAIGKIVIENNMSKNKTPEYFIGQIQPNENGFDYEIGNLYKSIENDDIYLIDEINLSGSSILTHFLSIFKTPYNESVAHPRCNKNFNKKFNLFATMNPAASTAYRKNLPSGFFSCSIIYQMPSYGPWDNTIIISSILSQFKNILEDYDQSVNFIVECHKKCLELSNDVTIRDMLKLAEGFKEIAKSDTIVSKEKIANLVHMVYSSKMINWNDEFEKKAIEYKGISKVIRIPNNITKPQFLLMEQMKEAIKMNRGIIIRGPSGIGKTFSIKKLAKNKKLLIIQLCAESDTSEIFGRYEPEYPDIKEMGNKIKKIIINMMETDECDENMKELFSEYLDELDNNENIYSVLKMMESNKDIMSIPYLSLKIEKYLRKSKNCIQFKYRISPLIDAIENGHWIVLENINLCPDDILESLNSLLDENHTFRINDGQKDIVYSMNPNPNSANEKRINEDFRIFMTSDDRILNSAHSIPAPFLSRCIVLQINSPKIDELPNIARNYYDATMFADFLCKCFKTHTNNHVRDIIRMTQIYRVLNINPNTSKPEISIAKTLKFILNQNYIIPNAFIIPNREYDHIIKEVLSIIQKNLFDGHLEDASFSPWTGEYIKNIFNDIFKSNQINDLSLFLKATLKLACYIFAKKSQDEFISLLNTISGRLITFLVCGYIISISDKQKEIPDFIWNLHFKPAIWDLLFISNDRYADFTTKAGFIEFLRSDIDETGEFAFEFYQFSKLNTNGYEKDKEKYSNIVDTLFDRRVFNESEEESINNVNEKNLIILEKLPLIFPSILDNKLIFETVNYSELIQIFDFLDIHPPYNEMMKLFNYDFMKYAIFNDYNFRFNNPPNLNTVKIYNKLLDYDLLYQYIKFISQIPNDSDDISEIIKKNISQNNITMDLLINKIDEMKKFCITNKTEITESLLEIIHNTQNIIQVSIQQKREKDELNKKQIEIFNRIKKLIPKVRNKFIIDEIENLRSTNQLTDELYHQIEKLVLFDSHISKRDASKYIKYKYNCLQNYFLPDAICEKIKFSVIITNFIVPPLCQNFLISPDVYSQFNRYSSPTFRIRELTDEINENALNKNQVNYIYLEQILRENSMNELILLKADLLNKKNISKIISYMDQFFINKCIVLNTCQRKMYIKLMLKETDKLKVKRYIKKDKKTKEEIDKLYKQYKLLLKKLNKDNEYNDDDDDDDDDDENNEKEIPIDVLRSNVDIPPEDWGQIILPWDENTDNNPKAQLAHYLTKLDALESKINDFPIENVELNNQEYQIIRIESLYYNYIYLTNLENIDQSVAAELGIIDTFNLVKESSNPLQMLKKDIIIFLSKMQRKNINEREMEIIKNAYKEIWENDNLDIKNDNLHILYNPHFRSKMIQYYNEKDLYDDFKLKRKNYSRDNEIRKIAKSIQDISSISNQLYNEIKNTFNYLLQHESKENQLMLDGISRHDEKSYIEKIRILARKFLRYVYPRSYYNGKCIQISANENSFIQRFNKLSDIGHLRGLYGREDVYEELSLNYDDQFVRIDQYNTFNKCYNAYKNWCDLNSKIYSIQYTPITEYNFPRIINTVYDISIYPNQEISNLCTKILNDIQNVRETERILERFKIQREPEIPQIYFENNKEPFRDIRDHLMIENKNGKPHLLAEINYDLRECYSNSQVKLNIINMSHSTVRTIPDTTIDQTNESIFMSIDLNNENQKIELINNNDNSSIGVLNFKCKFIHPEIYFAFSSPAKIENKTIYIKGTIYHQLTISIFSKSSVMSHHLQLDTLDGSELNEKNVFIQNTNEKIVITFSDYGKFKANMLIIFSANNININALINIDVDVDPNEHSLIYDAKTMEEITSNEKLTGPSYLIVKSPIKPEIEKQLKYWPNVRNIPYLHIIYANNHSIIKTMNNTINLKFGESYYHIDLNIHMNPKLIDFEKGLRAWDFYFKHTGDNVYFIENIVNYNVIVKFIFQKNVLEKLSFVEIPFERKNYSSHGLYISEYNFENNNLAELMKQIENTQNLRFTEDRKFIPWINIIKLFEKPENEIINKCVQNISRIRNFFIRDDQTFYVKATESSLISIDNIPDFSDKQITQNIISTANININEFNILKTIDPSNLFDIIKNLDKIKLGMQFYRQIYESDNSENKALAANISCIYRSLEFLDKCKIMEKTLNEVISIGHTLFRSNNKTNNIEIVHDKNESTENITFKYYKNKEKNEIPKTNDDNPNIDELKNKNKISPGFNTLDIIKPTELLSDTVNKILIILSGEEVKEKEEFKKVTGKIEENKEINEEDTNDNFYVTPLSTDSVNIDEINGPKNALKTANSINSKRYGLSNIETENKNLYLPNIKIKEGKTPNIDRYVIKVLECLVKYDFSISIPENHVTLLVDISFLSGNQNKNILCLNLFVAMETLNAFGIKFSVWMFADRPLRVCVKKPTDPYDNERKTIIREFYFLNRKNSESSPLSALYAINNLDDEKDSSLFIIFSTFISAQILSKHMNWQETALSCLDNRNLIGYIEPCQHINEEISNRLNEALTESSFTSFVRFKKNIYESIAELLMKIFALSLSKNNYQPSNVSNALSINLPFNKFDNNTTFESDIYVCKNAIVSRKSKFDFSENEQLKATQIIGAFEEIESSNMKFGNSNYSAYFLYPNKATRYEPCSKGGIIDPNGIVKMYITNGTYIDIFKQKTGEKIRDYIVDIVIDCSLIIKKYSLNHCFLSIVSILTSLKELEIPCVNLFAAGKELITILANQDLRLLSSSDALYSKIFSILIENASETRSLENALKTAISNSFGNSTSKIMYVFTDCLFGVEQEKQIKDIINYAQTNGTVIGIGTGPAPFKIEDIFQLGVWAKNPYMLREALQKLGQSPATKNVFKPYGSYIGSELPDEIPNMNQDNQNSLLLEQFEEIEYYNPCIPYGINEKAFGKDELTGDYAINSTYNPFKKGKYKGFKILVMMFYQGKKSSKDEPITVESFEKGMPSKDDANEKIKSPGEMIHEMGSEYKIVTTYKEALEELVTGTYSIAWLCTASKGISKGSNDENYFESFIKAIVNFFVSGGGLIMFAENPPFIFEINEILKALPGFTVRIDDNRNNVDKDDYGFMHESKGDEVGPGEFLNHHYTCSAIINGDHYNELPSLGGGIKDLFTGSTPAKFINIDKSFKIFSMTPKGNPSCIYRIPKGHEGLIIIDAAASKLFFEYTSTGTARYINNLPFICIHCSHFRKKYNDYETDAGIAVDTAIEPQISTRFRHIRPLLISIIIDATSSMSSQIKTCKEKLTNLIENCKEKIDDLTIYLQFVAYRDFCDIGTSYGMIESHEITNDPDKIQKFMDRIQARGGGDYPENIAAGYETALAQIESSALECNKIFIHLGDCPNHDSSLSGSHHQSGNKEGVSWDEVWKNIDKRIGEQNIDKIITISCGSSFDKQYEFWNKYNCANINKILDKKSISSESLESIIEDYIPDAVATMYG